MRDTPTLLVRKRSLSANRSLPAVEIRIRSDAAQPVGFRLRESFPRDHAAVDLGLEGDGDGWTVEGDRTAAFEGIVARGAPCETGYDVATTARQLRREYLNRPAVAVSTGPESGDWQPVDDAVEFHTVEDLAAVATR